MGGLLLLLVGFCCLLWVCLFVLFWFLLLADHQSWKTKSLENESASLGAYLVAILVWHRMKWSVVTFMVQQVCHCKNTD